MARVKKCLHLNCYRPPTDWPVAGYCCGTCYERDEQVGQPAHTAECDVAYYTLAAKRNMPTRRQHERRTRSPILNTGIDGVTMNRYSPAREQVANQRATERRHTP